MIQEIAGKEPEKVVKTGNLSVSSGNPANGVIKSAKTPQKMNVLPSMNKETVLDLDSKGVELYFDQKEDFLVLDETTIRALSQANRIRYSSARQFHENWRGQQDADFNEAFQVDRQFVGSDYDKLYDINVRAGVQHRWARPDRVAAYMAKGYHIMQPDEATTFLGSKGNRHEVAHNGKTELVLMGIDKKIYQKAQKDKVEKNNNRAVAWKNAGVEQLNASGSRGFVDETASSTGNRFNEVSEE